MERDRQRWTSFGHEGGDLEGEDAGARLLLAIGIVLVVVDHGGLKSGLDLGESHVPKAMAELS